MNKITLIGNLTHDPELRTTPNGVSVCTFSIAVNRRFANSSTGERVTDFFRITTWRQSAENCAKYLTRGKKVAVVGELQARLYEGNDGKTRMSLEVSADEVEFLSARGESTDAPDRYSPADRPAQAAPRRNSDPEPDGFVDVDDELPF